MSSLGDRALGSTVDLKFSTAVNGVPTALAGTPAVSVYISGTTTPITGGVTFTGSYNSTIGLNDVSVAATSGNGYSAGKDYDVVITTGTLGGVSVVGYIVGHFSLQLGNVSNFAGDSNSATTITNTLNAVPRGTVTTGASTTSVPTSAFTISGSAASGVVSNQFADGTIFFEGNTTTAGLRGVKKSISANTASNTPTLTVATLPATPASGDTFIII